VPGSFKIGRIAGIPVELHWSLGFAALLVGGNLAVGLGPAFALAGLLLLFGSVLAHEFAHALVARRYGVGTQRITLWLLGGVAQLRSEPTTPRAAGFIAAAGPLASLAVAAASVGAAVATAGLDGPSGLVSVFAWSTAINALLAVFNLLPGAPLDGGRILAAVRWGRHGDRFRADTEAGTAGQVVGAIVVMVGVWLILQGYGGIAIAVTGLFIYMSAVAEKRAAPLRRSLEGVRVGDLTWFGVARARADTDAETMLWQRGRLGGAQVVAVEQPDGSLAGLVEEQKLWSVPEEQRRSVRLASLAVPFSRYAQASPDEPLSQVLARLHPLSPWVTVWRGDTLVGVITPEALKRRLEHAAHTG
jgi:Zn-dependent protease